MAIETSYDNKYGSGDRRAYINIESNIPPHSASIGDLELMIDGDESTSFRSMDNFPNFSDAFLDIIFPRGIYINEIHLKGYGGAANALSATLLYQNELTNWVVISNNLNNTKPLTFELIKTKRLRIKPNRSWGFGINEILIKNYSTPLSILIKKENQYGYYKDSFQSLGTTYPTKEQFEKYGMKELSILEAGDKQFDYEMELISETDEEKCFSYSFDLNGQHKNMKSIDGIITE